MLEQPQKTDCSTLIDEMEVINMAKATLCWDCARSMCRCSWSQEFIPVPGWNAIPTRDASGVESYKVLECPEFVRDSYEGGSRRNPPLTAEEKLARKREINRNWIKTRYRRKAVAG